MLPVSGNHFVNGITYQSLRLVIMLLANLDARTLSASAILPPQKSELPQPTAPHCPLTCWAGFVVQDPRHVPVKNQLQPQRRAEALNPGFCPSSISLHMAVSALDFRPSFDTDGRAIELLMIMPSSCSSC